MKLIDEIIEILSAENSNLENALIKTKVLLHKMGEKSLLTWVNNEINGYSHDDIVPEYRIILTSIYGTATNGYTTRWNNYRLPTNHLNKKMQEQLSTQEMRESISALDLLSKSESTLQAPLPTEWCSLFSKGLAQGIYVESSYKQISQSQILQILTQIRSRLLDFLLELADKFDNFSENGDIKAESKKIKTQELFNNTVFGNNTTIIIGDKNSNISPQIISGNIDELCKVLVNLGITNDEIDELKVSIDKDQDSTTSSIIEYGQNVKNWLKKISAKAIENNSIKYIGEALDSFYGFITN
ncbi:hypothetical protein [Sulfurospirillum barnesii]|uniref:AbiTii domain-containing protein n=1 Tax=Sulfurospirillum barnesii (strain ATCC 700032 / DSM 10660 / SES-3) TaxID=760154 RepID=I3XX73_SULBS|nr:hypothetical protein [Sulfurospirillum barnesii]AFL68547.1 hypothetical protein Sulba_1253 [Sulfurospirillum barnesii SES-3]